MSDQPASLQLTVSGYPVEVLKDADGSVSITVHAGFPIGDHTITIPAAEWSEIVAYTAGAN
jgi:deoxyribose-phosphate aldolase